MRTIKDIYVCEAMKTAVKYSNYQQISKLVNKLLRGTTA